MSSSRSAIHCDPWSTSSTFQSSYMTAHMLASGVGRAGPRRNSPVSVSRNSEPKLSLGEVDNETK